MKANEEQLTAIEASLGVVRIMAGPGSGKTYVLAERVCTLIEEHNIPPSCILTVSFTVQAAQQLRSRLKARLGDIAELIEVKTLHALARSICLEGGHTLRLTTSGTMINRALRSALRHCQKDPSFPIDYLNEEYAIQLIDRIKQREPYALLDTPNRHDIQLCKAFDQNLKAMGFCTFQDLGPTALELLHKNPALCQRFQQRFMAVLVDEAQDLNPLQFSLLQKILPSNPNFTLVGDDDQAIYSWRGADPDALRSLPLQYPHTQTYVLSKNYRCPPAVVEASTLLIQNNQMRYKKSLLAHRTYGERIDFSFHESAALELSSIANRIETLIASGVQPNNIAILCRSNIMCNRSAITLQAHQIPVYAGNILTNPITDRFLSLLKVLHQGCTIPECCDIFQFGKNKIPKTVIQTILPHKIQRDEIPSFLAEFRKTHPTSPITTLLNRFFAPIEEARKSFLKVPLSKILQELFQSLDCLPTPNTDQSPSVYHKAAGDILSMSVRFNQSLIPLPSLISEVETRQKGYVGKKNMVHILTVHRSKGLEFDFVFVPSVQPGVFPPKSALFDNSALEEERRLFYVAMTRCKKKLYISHHQRKEEFPWNGFIAECYGESHYLPLAEM